MPAMGVNSIIRYHKALTAVSNTTIATFEGFWGHLVPLQTCIFSSKALASCSLTLHPLNSLTCALCIAVIVGTTCRG